MRATPTAFRLAGLIYLIVAIGGFFSELVVRASVRVPGDAAATAANIAQHATLFRAGFVTDLIDFTCFLLVGLLLYRLLKPVDPNVALAMLTLNAVSVAMQALNMLNHLAALLVATDPSYTAGWSAESSQALVVLFLDLHHHGYLIAQIFFGLFLLPLGYLVYRSGWFPKTLGAFLMLGAAGYIADLVAVYVSPGFQSSPGLYFALLGGLAELSFVVSLLVAPRSSQGALAWSA